MKKILYYFIVMTCSIHSAFVYAQYTYRPLVEEGKSWQCRYKVSGDTEGCIYKISGDTTIVGKQYKRLLMSNKEYWNDELFHYCLGIREDNKRVYVISNEMSKELLLYDFGLKVGDEVIFQEFEAITCLIPDYCSDGIHNDPVCLGIGYNPDDTTSFSYPPRILKVTGVDTLKVRDGLFRCLTFDDGYYYWTEGIGCDWGLFNIFPYVCVTSDSPVDLYRCFKDGKTLFTRPDFYYNAGSGYRNSYMFGPSVWEYYVDEEGDGGYFYRFHIGPAGPERRNDMYRYMVKGVKSDYSAYTPWKGYKNLPADEDAEFLLYIYEYRHKVYVAYDEYKAYLQKLGYDVSRLDAELPYEKTDDGLVVLYDFDKPVGAKVSTALDDNPLVSEQHFIDEEYDGVKENRDWQVLDDGTIVFSGIGYVGGGSRGGMLLDYLMPGENKPKSHLEFYAKLLDQGYAYDHHHEHTITAIKDIKRDAHEKRYNLFDLQGRRLRSTPQRGVYIRNGKKYVVK